MIKDANDIYEFLLWQHVYHYLWKQIYCSIYFTKWHKEDRKNIISRNHTARDPRQVMIWGVGLFSSDNIWAYTTTRNHRTYLTQAIQNEFDHVWSLCPSLFKLNGVCTVLDSGGLPKSSSNVSGVSVLDLIWFQWKKQKTKQNKAKNKTTTHTQTQKHTHIWNTHMWNTYIWHEMVVLTEQN